MLRLSTKVAGAPCVALTALTAVLSNSARASLAARGILSDSVHGESTSKSPLPASIFYAHEKVLAEI